MEEKIPDIDPLFRRRISRLSHLHIQNIDIKEVLGTLKYIQAKERNKKPLKWHNASHKSLPSQHDSFHAAGRPRVLSRLRWVGRGAFSLALELATGRLQAM